jgi:hypothetical protein
VDWAFQSMRQRNNFCSGVGHARAACVTHHRDGVSSLASLNNIMALLWIQLRNFKYLKVSNGYWHIE